LIVDFECCGSESSINAERLCHRLTHELPGVFECTIEKHESVERFETFDFTVCVCVNSKFCDLDFANRLLYICLDWLVNFRQQSIIAPHLSRGLKIVRNPNDEHSCIR
jgi:hypothetical protein